MKQRIATGIIAGVPFIVLLVLGGYWFAGLVYLLAIIGYDEYLRMMQLRASKSLWVVGLISLLLLVSPWDIQSISTRFPVESWIWFIMFALFSITVFTKNKLTIDHVGSIFLGIVYIGFGTHFMIETRDLAPYGLYYTMLVFVCIWATDSGAYFSGYFFGKYKLWPTISPKKTIEGALGGLIVSVVGALAFSWYDPELLSTKEAVLLGVVIAIVGQLGDLMQSAYKRVKGIKDSGTFLPGHGGILDRTDSWLIVFPMVHLLSLIPQ